MSQDTTLKEIKDLLVIEKGKLESRKRPVRPKVNWILSKSGNKCQVYLNLEMRSVIPKEKMENMLGVEPEFNSYQLYVNDHLTYTFKKMYNGDYKSIRAKRGRIRYDGGNTYPEVYVMAGETRAVLDSFIQIAPDITLPSLWSKIGEKKWKLVKGRNISNTIGAVLAPATWGSDHDSEIIEIDGHRDLNWIPFEGSVVLNHSDNQKQLTFKSGVESYDWVIQSSYPKWMKRANMPVLDNMPAVTLYDREGNKIHSSKFQVFLQNHSNRMFWTQIEQIGNLGPGINYVKIEYNGVVSYDRVFSVTNISLAYASNSLTDSVLRVRNFAQHRIKISEVENIQMSISGAEVTLKLRNAGGKIPLSVKANLIHPNCGQLTFEFDAPFEGLAIVDSNYNEVLESDILAYTSLGGYRILNKTNSGDTLVVSLKNETARSPIVITKEYTLGTIPLVSLQEQIVKLFSFSSVPNHESIVTVEITLGESCKSFEIRKFDYLLNWTSSQRRQLTLKTLKGENLDLYAMPLNCKSDEIKLISIEELGLKIRPALEWTEIQSLDQLSRLSSVEERIYEVPEDVTSTKLIVFSSAEGNRRVTPRFVSLDGDAIVLAEEERIELYNSQLRDSKFDEEPWKQLMAYYKLCQSNKLPFNILDQFKALGHNSLNAARAFLFFATQEYDSNYFIQEVVPEIERDLGFDFHWICSSEWELALNEIVEYFSIIDNGIIIRMAGLISSYLDSIKLNELFRLIQNLKIGNVERLLNPDIQDLRSKLGNRVLKELPGRDIPRIIEDYRVPGVDSNVKMLIKSCIAAGESILAVNNDNPLFGIKTEAIRQNIQCTRYLIPQYYKRILLQVINQATI